MSTIVESIRDAGTTAELQTRIAQTNDALVCAKELKDGMVKASSSMKSHLANMVRPD